MNPDIKQPHQFSFHELEAQAMGILNDTRSPHRHKDLGHLMDALEEAKNNPEDDETLFQLNQEIRLLNEKALQEQAIEEEELIDTQAAELGQDVQETLADVKNAIQEGIQKDEWNAMLHSIKDVRIPALEKIQQSAELLTPVEQQRLRRLIEQSREIIENADSEYDLASVDRQLDEEIRDLENQQIAEAVLQVDTLQIQIQTIRTGYARQYGKVPKSQEVAALEKKISASDSVVEIRNLMKDLRNELQEFLGAAAAVAEEKIAHSAASKQSESSTKEAFQDGEAPESSPEAPEKRVPKKKSWFAKSKIARRLTAAAVAIGAFFGAVKPAGEQLERPPEPAGISMEKANQDATNEMTIEPINLQDSSDQGVVSPEQAIDTSDTESLLSIARAKKGDSFIRIMDRFLNDEDNKADVLKTLQSEGNDKPAATLIREWRNQQLADHGIEWQVLDGKRDLVYTDNKVEIGDRFSLVESTDEDGNTKASIEWEKVQDIDDEELAEMGASTDAEQSPTPGVTIEGHTFDYGESVLVPSKDGIYGGYTTYQEDGGEKGDYIMVEGSRTVAGTDADIPDYLNINKDNVEQIRRGYMLGNFAVEPLPGDGFRMQFTQKDGKGIIHALAALLEKQTNMGKKDALKEANKIVKAQRDIVNMRTLSTHKKAPNTVTPGDFVTFKQTARGWTIESVETGS